MHWLYLQFELSIKHDFCFVAAHQIVSQIPNPDFFFEFLKFIHSEKAKYFEKITHFFEYMNFDQWQKG